MTSAALKSASVRRTWPGPHDRDAWAFLANQAMQAEMLQIDDDHAAAWHETMTALVAAGLDYDTFTEQRMDALKTWTRGRKLAQTNLRYKYNLRRRSLRLVRTDVKASIGR